MTDRFVETKTTGYFERLKNSVIGIFLGILLFLASFGVLYWNEGRVNFAKVAETAIVLPATGSPSVKLGTLVSVTGTLTSPETLGDPPYLAAGDYAALNRKAEMYAWEEDSKSETTKNTGGSQTTTTTYTYSKTWTENPENSSSFRESRNHQNPAKSIDSQTLHVTQAQVGDYQLDMNSLQFPTNAQVSLTTTTVLPQYQAQQNGNFLFMGKGSFQAPEIGDMRLSYQALKKNIQATVFGSLGEQNQLVVHKTRKKVSFYRLFEGTREESIESLALEHTIWTWIFRLVGFLMMWIGLSLVTEPLAVLLDFIPFIGGLARGASGFAAFIIAGVLSTGTILISIVLHNPIMLFLAAGLSCFIGYRWWKQQKIQKVDQL